MKSYVIIVKILKRLTVAAVFFIGGEKLQQRNCYGDSPWIKKIDMVFYCEKTIRQAVEDKKMETVTPEVRNGSGCPDPTVAEVIRHLDPIESILIGDYELKFPERWLDVVDKTYKWCKKQPPFWHEAVKRRYRGDYTVVICNQLGITPEMFYRLINRTKYQSALYAVQARLIYID